MAHALPSPCDPGSAQVIPARSIRHPTATLAATILGSSLAFIDGSVINVALPALDRDLHTGPEGLAWLINAYLLMISALTLLGGAAGDHYGRRLLFLSGIGLFLTASIVCALAPSLPIILAGRAAQGIGAAMLLPNSLALLGSAFEGETKGQAIGTWAGVGALAGAAAPLIGGWLVDALGWRSIFLLNLPVGLAAAWLAWRFVAEDRDARGAPMDTVGAFLVTAGLGISTWALTVAATPDAKPVLTIGGGTLGLALLAAFGWFELRRGENALMPLFLLRNTTFLGVTLLTLLLYAALGGLVVLLPFVLIRAKGYSPVEAGAAMLPIPILIGLGSRTMGKVTARIGGRLPMGLGAFMVAAGLALYWRIGTADASYWGEVLPATLLVALGMAVCVAPLTTTVMSSTDADYVGVASGFNSAVARIGSLIATALLGFVFVQESQIALVASAHAAALVGAALAAVAGLCAFLLIDDGPGAGPAHG